MAAQSEEKTEVNANVDFDKSKTPIRGPEAFPLLEIVQGPKQGVWFTVAHQKEITLGRAVTNHILLEDNSVSRSHAVLEARGENEFVIRDIGSRNGTFVNDKKIQGEVPLKHLDVIKVGIYLFRYLTEPTEAPFVMPSEEAVTVMEEPPEPEQEAEALAEAEAHEAAVEEAAAPAETEAESPEAEIDVAPGEEGLQQDLQEALGEEAAEPLSPEEARAVRGLSSKSFFILLGILLLLVGGGVLAYYLGAFDSLKGGTPEQTTAGAKESVRGEDKPPQTAESAKGPDQAVETTPLKPHTPAAEGQVAFFLEVNSEPLPAKIFYQGKELGITPFKVNVSAPMAKPQEITAELFLKYIDEKLDVKQSFTVGKQDELVKQQVKLPLGALIAVALPKEGRLFLEGKFKGEKGPAKSLELKEIEYNKPLYLPYGNYVAEIKVPESLGGSQNKVDQVRFRREFVLAPNQAEFKLKATDEMLKIFPAKINSQPKEAALLIDGKKVGETPYEGELPTGRHTLVLKKEGFSDFEKEINIELNTPYQADFNLETSPAGAFINRARDLFKQGKTQAAIEQLAEALKHQPDSMELSQIHLLLGESFLKSKNYDQAVAYFQKEIDSTEYGAQARLGLAQAFSGQGKQDQALIQVVDVYLKTQDEKLKSQAESAFKVISPMKSVLYVTSDPKGAEVTINGNAIGQNTPVILSDLMVGSYRVGVTKEGFKPFESRVTLPVSTIQPVVVKLEANQ